tara:strand:+ start:2264 stop:3067 length:804 start_codon:yes stop_codon:yes gene_type:complete
MAEHLASIYGTEKDRVNCPFYFKIGACRHGERCSRLHMHPTLSQTILMTNMYENPEYAAATGDASAMQMSKTQTQDHFEDFYQDVFEECARFGEVEGLNICDNLADHLVGNVYVKFRDEEHALAAKNALDGRYYDKRAIKCEFSPVTDFRESTCRQYEERSCGRAGYCNFMHLRKVSRELRKELFGRYEQRRRDHGRDRDRRGDRGGRDFERRDRARSRSRSRSRDRGDRRDEVDNKITAKGMSDEERRAMFAKWNEPGEKQEGNAE